MTKSPRSDDGVHWLEGKGVPAREVVFGRHVSYWWRHSPRRALHSMSYYKFAAKLIGKGQRVLDVGCGEGLGTWLLARECGWARGIDFDQESIRVAQANWQTAGVSFVCEDVLRLQPEPFDAVVSFDFVEHLEPERVSAFLRLVGRCLPPEGVLVVGTPNIRAQEFASPVARAGHVNCYSPDRLETEMRTRFRHVFMFGANDEVVHTGFLPMAHYLLAVGCGPV